MGIFSGLIGRIKNLAQATTFDRELFLAELERQLIAADVGVLATETLLENIRVALKSGTLLLNAESISEALKGELKKLLQPIVSSSAHNAKPFVVMFVGVNGVGKTTSVAKLAYRLRKQGSSVMLAAADTFRAAAVEQLQIWGSRLGVTVISGAENAKPSTVVFQALRAACDGGVDYLLVDTAGRLHNRGNLMQELEAVLNIIRREMPGAPQEILLVLDAATGQNAMLQAKEFSQRAGVTGLVLTKLDGTPKGGAVIAIATELKLPVRYVGVGEQPEDLAEFNAAAFVENLFNESSPELSPESTEQRERVKRSRRN